MSGVTLNKVIKRYGDVQVIHGINLDIEDGEFCVFVGPSGCGKSTLARLVTQIEAPTSGRLSFHGDNGGPGGNHRRKVQIVFQDPYRSLNPRRTVGQSIVEGPMNFGTDAATARISRHSALRAS